MYEFIKRSAILIPRSYENEPFYIKIKNFLTRYYKDYHTQESKLNSFFFESNQHLLIPRFFPIQKFVNCNIIDASFPGKDIDIVHKIEPRDKTQWNAIAFLMNNEKGIIKLSPGVGKTVVSIYSICEKKKKTIIVVHRDQLVDQWVDRFNEFTNIKSDDIAKLSSDTFVEDLKKSIIVCTVQTFISLIKRNATNFLTELYKANIGVSIFDEVHTSVGAPVFSESSLFIPSRQVFGLSATPNRYDGNTDIINMHLGEVFEDKDPSSTMKPRVTFVLFNFEICNLKMNQYIYWGGQFSRSRYLKQLKKSNPLIETVLKLKDKFYNDDRKVLIICERIKFIEFLYGQTKQSDKGKFISSAKLDDLLMNRIVYSTPGKIRDGIDDPSLDTLIITSPVSNMEQLGGRIIRKKDGKKTPIIIDLVDTGCPEIYRTAFIRSKFYESKGWELNFLLIDYSNTSNPIKEIDKEKFLDIVEPIEDRALRLV